MALPFTSVSITFSTEILVFLMPVVTEVTSSMIRRGLALG